MERYNDRRVFKSLQDPALASRIISIKNNDPEAKCLSVESVNDLTERAWPRLGKILRDASHVEKLIIVHCPVNVVGLCVDRLQLNQSIKILCLTGIDLGGENMSCLGPFLSHSPSLKSLILSSCNIGSAEIDLLSTALMHRSEDTLEALALANNHIGDIDLEKLASVLNRKKMVFLDLENNHIGSRGCDLLAKLLGSQECNLFFLNLCSNSIDDNAAATLTESLSKNTKLGILELGNTNGIATDFWSAMLKLVCNTSSIDGVLNSNPYLYDLSIFRRQDDVEALNDALDFDDTNLLCASLKINTVSLEMNIASPEMKISDDKTMNVRCKILWSHARGNLNIGNSSIATGVMPRILAWIGDYSDESNVNLIQYHKPPLPKEKMDAVRLGAIYRIVQSRPDLITIRASLSAASKKAIPSILGALVPLYSRNKGDTTSKKRRLA